MKRASVLLPFLLILCLAGCRTGGAPRVEAVPETVEPEPNQAVLWVRDSAEYYVALHQAYRLATERLEEAVRDREPGTWAVSMDADETLISNLGYSLRRAENGGSWSQDSWHEWVVDREATAIPGAAGFVSTVHRLGGKVAVVTNRDERHCQATRDNLEQLGFRFDVILCQGDEEKKDGRWAAVENGEGTGLAPLEIVMWVGDNIYDFPGMSQESRGVAPESLSDFGSRYVLLPNPIYGSWER